MGIYQVKWQTGYGIIIKDYPRAKDLPSAGFAAGPCLYKDTVQLYKELGPTFQIGLDAIKINENLPQYLIDQILEVYDLKNQIIVY